MDGTPAPGITLEPSQPDSPPPPAAPQIFPLGPQSQTEVVVTEHDVPHIPDAQPLFGLAAHMPPAHEDEESHALPLSLEPPLPPPPPVEPSPVYEPPSPPPHKQSPALPIMMFFLVLAMLGSVFFSYTQNAAAVTATGELSVLKDQLKRTQEEYAIALAQKIEVEATLASVSASFEELKSKGGTTSSGSGNFFSVKSVLDIPQRVGQSFRPNASIPVSLVGIRLYGTNGTGKNIVLNFYEYDGKTVGTGKKLGSSTVPAKNIAGGKPFEMKFTAALSLDPKKTYVFTLEGDDTTTQVDIEFTGADTDNTGTMYAFTRLVGADGAVLDMNHSWQSRAAEDLRYEAIIAQ